MKLILGTKFTRWTVIKEAGSNKHGHLIWLCRCDCGNEKTVAGTSLRFGHSKSCGCLNKEIVGNIGRERKGTPNLLLRLPRGFSGMNSLYGEYTRSAKKKGLSFKIDKFQFIHITQERCFYCGKSPGSRRKTPRGKGNGDYIFNGIDRVDNDKGYNLNNVVPCCKECNIGKQVETQEAFITRSVRIAKLRGNIICSKS